MSEQAQGDIIEIWENLEEIFKDGKVVAEEMPKLLQAIAVILSILLDVLSVVGLDAKVILIMKTVSATLITLSEKLEREIPDIKLAWNEIAGILEDEKIKPNEIKDFVIALSNLLESLLTLALPFVNVEMTDGMLKLTGKLQKLIKWFEDLEKLKIG
jgi:hypothetical protein